jgi:hypothetical protein
MFPRPAMEAMLRLARGQVLPADRYWLDPVAIFADMGMKPDPWQSRFVRSYARSSLLLCSRQSGKSTATGAMSAMTAIREPGSLILLLSPTLRQSGELFRDKVLPAYRAACERGAGVPSVAETALSLHLANGSRVVSLPENEAGIRGFSGVAMIVIDEASRVSDALYLAVRPMLATTNGRLVALTTPFGKRGWFHREWEEGGPSWERTQAKATECPRVTRAFLAEELRALGERAYAQEYECAFNDSVDSVFSDTDIQAARTFSVAPMFPGE